MTNGESGQWHRIEERSLLAVSGADAEKFLVGLVTNSLPTANAVAHAGLLTPQGKVLSEFFIWRVGDTFLLDVAAPMAADLLKRLTFYRLRAAVVLADVTADWAVAFTAVPTTEAPLLDGMMVADDPRHTELGARSLMPAAAAISADLPTDGAVLETRQCVRFGVAQLGMDAPVGNTFPHELLWHRHAGVDFAKGCYVGQEVVSRMKHKATPKRIVAPVTAADGTTALPSSGTPILAGDTELGTLGAVDGTNALAALRIDRFHRATKDDQPITVGGVALSLRMLDDLADLLAAPDKVDGAAHVTADAEVPG